MSSSDAKIYVPEQNRLFAHKSSDRRNYCYGSFTAYEFRGDFEIVRSLVVDNFPYHSGYAFSEDFMLKQYPHFYTVVENCGKFYGYLLGVVFRFDGLQFHCFQVPKVLELPHNRLISVQCQLYLIQLQQCYIFNDLGQTCKMLPYCQIACNDLRMYAAGGYVLFRQNSQQLMQFDIKAKSFSSCNLVSVPNLWYEGRFGDILYFCDSDLFMYLIVDCRLDICVYRFQARSLIKISVQWDDLLGWRISNQYIAAVLSMHHIDKYNPNPYVFKQIQSEKLQDIKYTRNSDYCLHKFGSISIAQKAFQQAQPDFLRGLFDATPDLKPLLMTYTAFAWMILQTLRSQHRTQYQTLVSFIELFDESPGLIYTAFLEITRADTSFEPYACFPVDVTMDWFFQRENDFQTQNQRKYITLVAAGPKSLISRCMDLSVKHKNAFMLSELLQVCDSENGMLLTQSEPLSACIQRYWLQGIEICLKSPGIQQLIQHQTGWPTFLSLAARAGVKIEPFLVQVGQQDQHGVTALMLASSAEQVAILAPLEMHYRDFVGRTALIRQAQNGAGEGVLALLSNEAGACDISGQCALDYATMLSNKTLIGKLLKAEHHVFHARQQTSARRAFRREYFSEYHRRMIQLCISAFPIFQGQLFEESDIAYKNEFGWSLGGLCGRICAKDIFGRDYFELCMHFERRWRIDNSGEDGGQ